MPESNADGAAARWTPAPISGDLDPLLAAGYSRRLATLLSRRGISSATAAAAFLKPDVADLHDPLLLPGASAAVERLLVALRSQQPVAIVGDYDVDGVTATAILVAVLQACGVKTHPILPERLAEGYGFQSVHVQAAAAVGCGLIVTADCGSTATAAAEEALAHGIDVIVTDHHLGAGTSLPAPVIEVNPHRPDSQYPFPGLSGAGVVFKLACGLLQAIGREVSIEALLRIACLGTICDLVPLVDENRIIAAKGLEALPQTRSVGLGILMSQAAVTSPVSAVDVGFRIGPRLNAAGRLASPRLALDLLLTTDRDEARRLAAELDNLNRLRQEAEMAVVEEAATQVEASRPLPAIIVVARPHWHPGVLGIAAGRIARTYHRPAILLQTGDEVATGSGRSIASVQLFEFLHRWQGDYERFGGHAQAIGISIRVEDLERLTAAWQAAAAREWDSELLSKCYEYELELDAEELDDTLLSEIAMLEPFGVGNRQPLLKVGPLHAVGEPRLFGRGHLSVKAQGAGSGALDLVGWGWQDRAAQLTDRFEALGTLERDRYTNRPSLRLVDARRVVEIGESSAADSAE